MTPTLVAKTDIVYVWECGIEHHRHRTEVAAINCINKPPGSISDRNNEIYKLSRQLPMKLVAEKFGLSYGRVLQIVKKMRGVHD